MKQIQLYVTLHCIPVLFQYEGTSLLQDRHEPRKRIAKNEQVSGNFEETPYKVHLNPKPAAGSPELVQRQTTERNRNVESVTIDICSPVQTTTVRKGSHFTIMVSKNYMECKKYQYTWYFKSSCIDSETIHIAEIEKYKNTPIRKPSLTIRDFENSDSGTYQCYIQSEKGCHKEEFTLIYAPNVEIATKLSSVLTGTSSFIIECIFREQPNHICWYFKPNKGEQIIIDISKKTKYEGGTKKDKFLKILNIDPKDEGEYTCRACFKFGIPEETSSTTIKVKRIELIPSEGFAYVGDTSFTFHCCIKGGDIQIKDCKWFKSSGDGWTCIEISAHYDINKLGFTESTDMMNLTVKNIDKSDALKYKYEATVDDGSILSSSATLSVKERKELKMILVGTVQSGKSSTGNAILGFDAFESKRSGDRMTLEIKKQQAAKEDKRVIVVDTPGLFCMRNKETFLRHINKGIEILSPGPHAFIFVFSIMSISDLDLKMLTYFVKNKSLKDYIIVVFTGRDMLEKDKTDFGTFRAELPLDLRSFLRKIGTTRIFAFDNTKSDKAVEKLIEAVDMLSTAKKRYFEI